MTRHPLRSNPAALLTLACALWGGATVLNKALLPSIPPVTLLVLQLAPSALLLWVLVLIRGTRLSKPALLVPLVLLGILNPGISYTLSLIGLARVSASIATLLWAAEPVMILCLAALVLREPVTGRLLLSLLIGAVGVALVTQTGRGLGMGGNDPVGILLLLCAVLCCAFYTVFSRKLTDSVDPMLMIAVQQAAGLAWAMALLLANTRYGTTDDLKAIPPNLLACAALSGVLYYAAAYWLYMTALKSVPAAVVGSYFNLIPVFGVGLAYLFLGERLGAMQWAGAAAITLSVLFLTRQGRRRSSGVTDD